MKRTPETAKLETTLRSSKLVADGFLGDDTRPLDEIIEADAAIVAKHNTTVEAIAARMREITRAAEQGMGNTVEISSNLEAEVLDTMGKVPCPWPHSGVFCKTVTVVKRKDTGATIRWSELNIHLIEKHGFFEGKGTAFRLEPDLLIKLIL